MGPAAAGVTGAAALAVAVLVVHNLVTNLWFTLPTRSYVPLNLATAAVLVALARGHDIGLSLGESPAVGIAAAALVLATVGLLWAMPGTRPLLVDRRMEGVDARGTAWRALVRIPLGTVVLEEVAFRGVLPALLSPLAASVLFGLWHVTPTIRTLDTNHLARTPASRLAAVAGAVAVTTVVGAVFWALRSATGSLLAPALVHVAANSGATVAAAAVLRSAAHPATDLLPGVTAEQAEEQAS